MRTSLIGLAAATAVGISVVALPPALAAHSAPSAAAARASAVVKTLAVPAASTLPALAGAAGHYPTNTTTASIRPTSQSFPRPTTIRFSGSLVLNGHGIRTDHLRIFSVKKHAVVATVRTDASGTWVARIPVSSSDWFFAMYSGTPTYQPALSGISRITIGSHPATR